MLACGLTTVVRGKALIAEPEPRTSWTRLASVLFRIVLIAVMVVLAPIFFGLGMGSLHDTSGVSHGDGIVLLVMAVLVLVYPAYTAMRVFRLVKSRPPSERFRPR